MSNNDKAITEQQNKDHQLRFWLLQLCGWLPFYCLLLPLFGDDYFLSPNSLLFASSITILAILGSLLLRKVLSFSNSKVSKNSLWMVIILLGTLPIAMSVAGFHQVFWFLSELIFSGLKPLYQSQPYSVITGLVWFVYVLWSSLYLLFTNQDKLSQAIIEQQKLELLVKENKISRLLEQLNPHFMFNTINNIRALILKDSDSARDMLSSFADIMRYQLNSNNDALVTLEDELAFVLEFIELHRLQLGKRLNFTQDIDTSLLSHFIPRMALQLLVENALKHGFSQSAKPANLIITIAYEPQNNISQAWFLSVQNNGTIEDEKPVSGIGLKNLQERLTMAFDNSAQFTLTEKSEFVEAKILFN